ncbi:hypothetical protein Emed_006817 [Eimeria media]
MRVHGGWCASRARDPRVFHTYGGSLLKKGVTFASTSLLLLFFLISSEDILFAGSIISSSRGSSIASFARARKHALSVESRLSLQDQTTTQTYYPSLSLEEDDDCVLVDGVPANVPAEKKVMKLTVDNWVNQRDATVEVQGALRAEQTLPTIVPGSGQQFILTFTVPSNIFLSGPATLALYNTSQNGSDCPTHALEILRMQDDSFTVSRDDSKALTDTTVTLQVGSYLTYSEVDVSPLIYGKVGKGEKVHLLFREKHSSCWSVYQGPKEGNVPYLSVSVIDSTPIDATYEEWGEFSKCRVSCTSTVNFQCRKRACLPGVGSGSPCLADEMLQRRSCQNPLSTAKCTCQNLQDDKACPTNSTCVESTSDGARCTCNGGFSRTSAAEKTKCPLPGERTPELGSSSSSTTILSSSTTTTTTEESTTDWTKWYWIGGGCVGVLVIVLVALMFMKKSTPPAHIEAVPGMQPGAPGYWPQGEGQGGPPGGVPDMTINSAFALAPVPPGTRMQGPPGPPGPPRMF